MSCNWLSATTKPQAALARLQLIGSRRAYNRLNRCIDKVKSEYKAKEEVLLIYYSTVAAPVGTYVFVSFQRIPCAALHKQMRS